MKPTVDKALQNAEASLKMEGMHPSVEVMQKCKQVLQGKLTHQDYIADIKKQYMETEHVKMSEKTKTGWEQENRVHFDEIVVSYDRARWNYPNELYVDIFEYVGAGSKKALEIGAGTGKATAPFLNAGYNVTAVEMGANMSDFLREKFRDKANFNLITTTFEDALLQDDSYDLVYAASAFHWIDAQVGCPKVLRLLKDGGVFALFRNNAVLNEKNAIYNEIQKVYEKHYGSHYKSDERPVKISEMQYEDFLKPEEIFRGFRLESLEQYGFVDIGMKLYDMKKNYNADDYIELMETMSDHRALPEENRMVLYGGIKEAINKHGGQLQMDYIFQLYMGRKP